MIVKIYTTLRRKSIVWKHKKVLQFTTIVVQQSVRNATTVYSTITPRKITLFLQKLLPGSLHCLFNYYSQKVYIVSSTTSIEKFTLWSHVFKFPHLMDFQFKLFSFQNKLSLGNIIYQLNVCGRFAFHSKSGTSDSLCLCSAFAITAFRNPLPLLPPPTRLYSEDRTLSEALSQNFRLDIDQKQSLQQQQNQHFIATSEAEE